MNKISTDIKQASSKAWGFVPEPIRGVVYLAAAAGLVYGAYRLYNKITAPDPVKGAKNDMSELAKKGILPTLSDSQIQGLVSRITAAAAGQNFAGTDEKAIYSAFALLKNDADFNKLVIAFGEQRKSFSFAVADLYGFVSSELDDSEITYLNKLLTTKGLSYKI
jgi:hypothetical protein